MAKGFKDNKGKFRPTGKKQASALSSSDLVESKSQERPRDLEHEKFLKEHFDTGLKLSNGWKVATFPPIGNERVGDPINSRSGIEVEKGSKSIRLTPVDGRLGGGYNVVIRSDKTSDIFNHFKKYDEALDNVHSLMKIL